MRTTLNLSERPFSNHRLLYIAVAAIVLISLWLYLWTSSQRSLVTARADSLAVRVRDARDRLEQARQQNQKNLKEHEQPPVSDMDRLELASARQLLARDVFSGRNTQIAEHGAGAFAVREDVFAQIGGRAHRPEQVNPHDRPSRQPRPFRPHPGARRHDGERYGHEACARLMRGEMLRSLRETLPYRRFSS